jgi:sec-independent protein translocase protein TatC
MALVPFPQKSVTPAEEPDWDDTESAEGGKMSFLEHLDELRRRLIWALLSLVVGVVIAAFFLEAHTFGPVTISGHTYGPWTFGILDFVIGHINSLLAKGEILQAVDPTEGFSLYVKLAVIAGLLIASPLVMLQVWLFIAPGLYAHEKKLAIPFVLLSSVFLIIGAWFGHAIVFPMSFSFLVSVGARYFKYQPRIDTTFALYLKMVVAFAVVFQMPTVVLFLAKMGLVTARFLMKQFKYAVLIIFIVAAIITPDGSPVTQTLIAGPMCGLYLFSALLAWMFGKRRRTTEDEA